MSAHRADELDDETGSRSATLVAGEIRIFLHDELDVVASDTNEKKTIVRPPRHVRHQTLETALALVIPLRNSSSKPLHRERDLGHSVHGGVRPDAYVPRSLVGANLARTTSAGRGCAFGCANCTGGLS